ncbi:MAG: threonine/homoserine/homoserine lactone efflux protein [Verrucomicrobiales bacterium]|jgi:threonine/homoserine/homoserine lactone efflux protein
MSGASLLSFLVVALLIVITPGPDTMLVLRNSIGGERNYGLHTALGVNIAIVLHGLGAVIGVSTILIARPWAFDALKFLGALYLLYLGLGQLAQSRHHRPTSEGNDVKPRSLSSKKAIAEGFATNALNPEVGLFFLALLPQFVNPEGAATRQTIILTGLFIGLGLLWLFGVSVVSRAAGHRLMTSPGLRVLSLVSSIAFLALAARSFTELVR